MESAIASPWSAPLALTLVHVILAALAFHEAPFNGGDDAAYISLARSLMERHDYTNIWDPALPPHTQYPPIFPIIVASGLLAGLSVDVGLKLMMLALSSAAVFASCVWLRRVTSPGIAFCAGFFIAISPEIITLGREVLSDAPFWLFSTLALLAWYRADRDAAEAPDRRMPVRWVVFGTTALIAAYFTRSAGVPLLVATIVWLALRRQPRAMAVVVGCSLPLILAWWLRGHSHGADGYLAPFLSVDPYNPSRGTVEAHDLGARLWKNITRYASRQIPRLVFGGPRSDVVLGTTICVAMLFGWVRRLRRPGLAEIWLPLYLGVVVLWPVTWGGPRFLLPIVPLIALYVGDAAGEIAKRTRYPAVVAAVLLLAGAWTVRPALTTTIALATACREQYAEGGEFPCTESIFRDFYIAAQLTRGHLPEGSVVISRKPTLFFLYSGYRSQIYPLFARPDSLFNLADRIGAKYVVVDQISDLAPRYLHPILLARRDDFCVMPEMSRPDAVLLRIEIDGPPRAPGSPPNAFRRCDAAPVSALK
ncbi:MAG: hypothetical protein ABI681_02990 [Gemmatimonadales bacterium]